MKNNIGSLTRMKEIKPFLFGFLILLFLLILVFLVNQPSSPIFSMPSGLYDEPFMLSLQAAGNNESIHYTLDGSIPTLESTTYSEPLMIGDRSGDPNGISMIPTISYRPAEPDGIVFKVTVVRARSFNNLTKAPGPTITNTYLVHPGMENRYSLPIVSLVVEPSDFFDQANGIYVTGQGPEVVAESGEDFYFWPANYHERGGNWERPVHFEYFDGEGHLQVSQNAGIRIHGYASRSFRQKSFRLYADPTYDIFDTFKYRFFPSLTDISGNQIIDSFPTLILRNSGTDWGSAFMRDMLIQKLVEHTSLDTQANQPVIVFLNGEYWGLYILYERYDEGYFQNHYGIDPADLIVLEDQGDSAIGLSSDRQIYQDFLDYFSENNVKDPKVYSEIEMQMDIDNFIDYQITEIFIAHTDWPSNNIKYWRTRSVDLDPNAPIRQDGRWRWLLFDVDHGFIDHQINSIQYATREDLPTLVFRTLLQNDSFRFRFLNRFADHLNTTFKLDRVIREIDQIEAILEPEMQEQIDRWHSSGNSMEDWHNNVNLLRSFAGKRPDIMRQDLVDFFNLEGTFKIILSVNSAQGYVNINTIDISPATPGIENAGQFEGIYFRGVPVSITAIPSDGYRFSHWEGSIFDGETNPEIKMLSDQDIHLQAIFVPSD